MCWVSGVRCAHLATSGDEDLLRVGVSGQGRVHERLVVHVLIVLGALHETIGDEKPAEGRRLHHLHLLELTLSAVKNLLHLAASGAGEGQVDQWRGLEVEMHLFIPRAIYSQGSEVRREYTSQ